MARELTLEIVANTTQAEQALQQTERALQGVEKAAAGADKQLSALDELAPDLAQKLREMHAESGKLKDKLKENEQASQGAATGMQGLTAAVARFVAPAAVGSAIKYSIDFADNLKELSQQSGFSIKGIQTLGFVAQSAGSSIQAVANAANQLDVNLSKGGDRIAGAIDKLGFETGELLAMQPEERFRTIAVAIGGTVNPAERAELAMTLFGRAGRDLLPMMQELAEGAESYAPRMSNAWVEHMAKVSDATDVAWGHLKDIGMWLLTFPIHQAMSAWDALLETMENLKFVTSGIVTGLPAVPGRPTGGLFNTDGPAFDPLNGQSMGFVERQLTQGAQELLRRRATGGGNVLPFPQRVFSGGTPLPLRGTLGFPGFAMGETPFGFTGAGFAPTVGVNFPGMSFQGFDGTGFAPTVGMNAPGGPGALSRFFSGTGGRLLGMGAGMLTGLIPGMSGRGSSLGSMAGGAIGSIGSLAGSTLGSFLGPIGGIVGGLVGKLFRNEGRETNRTRDSWISDNFGSVDALREAADKAGFSVDKMLSTKKVKDFEAEVRKLQQALGDSQADAQRTEEAMQRWGLTIQDMGPKFQQTKINDAFKEAMEDLRVLTNAGADFNTVAEKMAPALGGLIQEAIEMGGTVPRELEPILKKMIEMGVLVDKNGDKFTDLSQIPFAQDLNKDFQTLISKMDALIDKIAKLPGLFEKATDASNDFADSLPNPGATSPGDPGGTAGYDSGGYAGRSWRQPSLRDTIPAMLRPGELVLTPEQQRVGGVSIGNLIVNTSASNRAQFVRDVGEAVVSYYEKRGRRIA